MERVLGIGGFHFRASDPESLEQWYARCLGVELRATGSLTLAWAQQGLVLPVQPEWSMRDVPAKEGALTDSTEADVTAAGGNWMLTFRVRDLDAMVGQLRANGVAVDVDPEGYSAGRFARFADPRGNPLAIWELQGSDARE